MIFCQKQKMKLKNIKNLTRKSLAEIRQKMNELDWHFKVTNKKQKKLNCYQLANNFLIKF
ncbi:DNA-directed RNA polymerase subunit alpha C-terminal domain-containing protein [Spiroplasma endosymbiont of Glossina fuscipes fuscipes]|uniref:DNA-directed RNA polymerase subunit alpha C-terminal domain-containing protein n=2 Tax=Spiroplasma endosymbiont of Glossina fuscipes fuscipes TaxID=2004463 RepID=UPI003C745B93